MLFQTRLCSKQLALPDDLFNSMVQVPVIILNVLLAVRLRICIITYISEGTTLVGNTVDFNLSSAMRALHCDYRDI
jgi:hypothetical protein